MPTSEGEVYKVYISSSARKEAKKLPPQVREAVLVAGRVLETEPYAGERLTGSLHMLYSFHFSVGQSQYRIAYTLDHPHQLVIVHLIQSRENFYEKQAAVSLAAFLAAWYGDGIEDK
jgi:mRNA-degrading endonuclease RelE of RelBE toxin-antitoxin system